MFVTSSWHCARPLSTNCPTTIFPRQQLSFCWNPEFLLKTIWLKICQVSVYPVILGVRLGSPGMMYFPTKWGAIWNPRILKIVWHNSINRSFESESPKGFRFVYIVGEVKLWPFQSPKESMKMPAVRAVKWQPIPKKKRATLKGYSCSWPSCSMQTSILRYWLLANHHGSGAFPCRCGSCGGCGDNSVVVTPRGEKENL